MDHGLRPLCLLGGAGHLSVFTRLLLALIEIGLIGVIYLFSQFRTRLRGKDLYA